MPSQHYNEISRRQIELVREQIVEQIEAYVDLGIDYFMLGVKDVRDLTTVELLAREVFPYFKKP